MGRYERSCASRRAQDRSGSPWLRFPLPLLCESQDRRQRLVWSERLGAEVVEDELIPLEFVFLFQEQATGRVRGENQILVGRLVVQQHGERAVHPRMCSSGER